MLPGKAEDLFPTFLNEIKNLSNRVVYTPVRTFIELTHPCNLPEFIIALQ